MAPETEDYKALYLDQRFATLDQKLDTVISYQKNYAQEAKVLEERVKVVERLQLTCPIDRVTKDLTEHKEATAKEIEQLRKDTEDIRYYKGKPDQLKVLITGFIILVLLSIIPFIQDIISLFK